MTPGAIRLIATFAFVCVTGWVTVLATTTPHRFRADPPAAADAAR